MPFMIETFDKAGHHDLRLKVRPAHLEYLDAHASLLIACGAKLSDDNSMAQGGLYLLDVESRIEADHFIQADPFYQAKLFERVEICRWRKAYLDGKNTL
jgi:uncharacterized protein YciI